VTTTTSTTKRVDASTRRFNSFVVPLLRLGVPLGPMYLLTVRGRRTGQPRTTPVATFTYEGGRYVMQARPGAAWVGNARAAGEGTLGSGRRTRPVALTEVPVEERRALLRHVGRIAPKRLARSFVDAGLIESTDAEAFAASAPTTAIFRVQEAV
jgi:deazaflavin-dependent oxidoreductase (nitroreductase family)